MWKFLRGGATVIPGATFIPESRVEILFQFYLTLLNNVKEIGRLFQIFVAFSEYYTNLPIFLNGIKGDLRFYKPMG